MAAHAAKVSHNSDRSFDSPEAPYRRPRPAHQTYLRAANRIANPAPRAQNSKEN